MIFNSSVLMNISVCQCKLNKINEALFALNRAIKYNPGYTKALVKRGEINMSL